MSDISKAVVAILSIPAIIAAYIWASYVATVIWAWFVVEQFGMSMITIPQAMGIGLVITIFTLSFARRPDLDKIRHADRGSVEKIVYNMLEAYIVPTLTLGIGWIVRQFM